MLPPALLVEKGSSRRVRSARTFALTLEEIDTTIPGRISMLPHRNASARDAQGVIPGGSRNQHTDWSGPESRLRAARYSLGLALLFLGLLKVSSAFVASSEVLSRTDPVLGISRGSVMLITGAAELCCGWLVLRVFAGWLCGLVGIGMAQAWLTYRYLLATQGASERCG